MNEDGTMARTPDIEKFAETHDLKICTIDALIDYMRVKEQLVEREAETRLPTKYGDFKVVAYNSTIDGITHLALVHGEIKEETPVLVRVQSECLTGDIFGSLRCDCNIQLHNALRAIVEDLNAPTCRLPLEHILILWHILP